MTMLPPDPLYVIQKDLTSVMCILIIRERNRICCGTLTGDVHFSDLVTYRRKEKFKNSEESCLSLNETPELEDGLLVQDKTGTIRQWSRTDTGWKKLKEIPVDYIGFCPARIYNKTFIVPFSEGRLKLYNLPDLEEGITHKIGDSIKQNGEVMTFRAFMLSSKHYIIVATECGAITIVDCDSGKQQSEGLTVADCPMAIDFDSVTMRGVIGTSTKQLTIFAVSRDLAITIYRTVQLVSEGVSSIEIRGDRKLCAIGCWDGRLRLLSWKTFVTLAVLDTHSQTINCVAFTPDKPFILAAGCKEGRISLWDIYNPKQ